MRGSKGKEMLLAKLNIDLGKIEKLNKVLRRIKI